MIGWQFVDETNEPNDEVEIPETDLEPRADLIERIIAHLFERHAP